MENIKLADRYEAQESWNRARRGMFIQKILCAFNNSSLDLIPFEEVKTRLHLIQKLNRGLQEIELNRIRGSVGRYKDFTSAFLPRQNHLRKRWQRVHAVFFNLGTPPIEVYQVGDAYFVIDGNHRVSIARQVGMRTIPAYVTEYITPVGLSAEADLEEVLLKAEYYEFLKKTKLDRLRPELDVLFTNPGNYQKLECLIEMFYEALKVRYKEEVAFIDAVLLWFDLIYAPAVTKIKKSGALEQFPQRTEADLFIWMWKHQKKLTRIKSAANA
jgi:hypothetical protein